MERELISVIIPVYNVEKYLKKCIESVLNQTYENIEIILVDDGSTDNSGNICDEYCEKYKKVKTFHKKNGGLSDARNYGIDNARGKYISFIDSDDFVTNDFIEFLYCNLKKNRCKISACGFCHYFDDGKVEKMNYENIEKKYNNIEAQKFLNVIGYFNASVCNKLFEKELFENCKFPKGKTSEDLFIIYKLIDLADGIYYSSEIKYFYRQRNGSITKNEKLNVDVIEAAKKMCEYYEKNNFDEVIPYGYQTLVFSYIGIYNNLILRNKNKEAEKIRNECLKYKKKCTLKELKCTRKVEYILFVFCIKFYNHIFKLYDIYRTK